MGAGRVRTAGVTKDPACRPLSTTLPGAAAGGRRLPGGHPPGEGAGTPASRGSERRGIRGRFPGRAPPGLAGRPQSRPGAAARQPLPQPGTPRPGGPAGPATPAGRHRPRRAAAAGGPAPAARYPPVRNAPHEQLRPPVRAPAPRAQLFRWSPPPTGPPARRNGTGRTSTSPSTSPASCWWLPVPCS